MRKLDRWVLGRPAPIGVEVWRDRDIPGGRLLGLGWVAHHGFPEIALGRGLHILGQTGMHLAVRPVISDSNSVS